MPLSNSVHVGDNASLPHGQHTLLSSDLANLSGWAKTTAVIWWMAGSDTTRHGNTWNTWNTFYHVRKTANNDQQRWARSKTMGIVRFLQIIDGGPGSASGCQWHLKKSCETIDETIASPVQELALTL